MTYQEMLGIRLDPEKAQELLAQIALLARSQEDPGPEINHHHFHSRAELLGYKIEKLLEEEGLFGVYEQRRIGEKV